MIFIPWIIVIVITLAFAPTRGGRGGRSQKGLFGTLIDGQHRTERRNNSHRGVMCSPSGSKRRRR